MKLLPTLIEDDLHSVEIQPDEEIEQIDHVKNKETIIIETLIVQHWSRQR